MASNPSSSMPASAGATNPGVDPMPPAARRRLQQCYEHGMKLMEKEKYDSDYTHTMFAQCVVADPGNLIYVEAFLANLDRKYNGNKKGSRFPTLGGSKSAFKKAVAKKDWAEALKLGPDALKSNPWDTSVLRGMAEACEAFDFREVELRYLRFALDADPKDAEVNRHCAKSLQRIGQFDQAIACWHRVEEAKPSDAEAPKMISAIQTEKTRARAGFGPAQIVGGAKTAAPKASAAGVSPAAPAGVKPGPATTASAAAVAAPTSEAASVTPSAPAGAAPASTATTTTKSVPAASTSTSVATLSPAASNVSAASVRQSLEQARAGSPEDVGITLKLARLLIDDGDVEAAERVITESIAACGQDLRLREQLEEVQVAKPRVRLAVAERLAEQQQTPQSVELVQQLRVELARAELAFYTVRTERYSGNMELKYQLGVRLRRLGNFAEAIKVFAQSLESEPVRALSLLEMGECHQRLKQYAKAAEAYQQAILAAQLPGQLEVKKHGLYRAANLAVGLRDFALAERLYGELLSLDPAFKDARDRLDKIPQIRDSG